MFRSVRQHCHCRHALLAALLMLASATPAAAASAQEQLDRIRAAMQDARMLYTACVAAVVHKPAYAALLPHTEDVETLQHTPAQLTDRTLPSASEAELLTARTREWNVCRTQYLNALTPVRPDLVPIVVDAMSAANEHAMLLAQRQISWGEDARRATAVNDETKQKSVVAQRLWLAGLRSERQAEVAQSQAAAAAMVRWAKARALSEGFGHPVIVGR